jgi:hypothetical protein
VLLLALHPSLGLVVLTSFLVEKCLVTKQIVKNQNKLHVMCLYVFMLHRTVSSPKSNDWGSWPSDSSLQSVGNGSSARKGKKQIGSAKEGLLIDLAEGKGNDWNSKWEDDAWEMLNKKE